MAGPRTLFDKVWDAHVVLDRADGQSLLYIDRQLLHEGSKGAFAILKTRGIPVRRPDLAFATPDHYVATAPDAVRADHQKIIDELRTNTQDTGIAIFGQGDVRQGIVHIIGPEQGLTQPGLTLVCGDSHTATHGAFGALAFGIGTTEVAHVMATQTLWQAKPRRMRITVNGKLSPHVTAKDMILAIIGHIGAAGATGHAVEYTGTAIRSLSMEGRMTVCNMSIEAGARSGMIAPDETTFAYLKGRPYAPLGAAWDAAVVRWRMLYSDDGAVFDREVVLDADAIAPMVTWGTSPEDAVPVTGQVPLPSSVADPSRRARVETALHYMSLSPGQDLAGLAFDRVFIGSCTNSRIEDLRVAAAVLKGRRVKIPTMIVPGSGLVKAQAEAEALDQVFLEAGAEWRTPGCSMCVGMNGDIVAPGARCASTTNRNFMGRQGPGARTHLMSPAMAAAVAVTGELTDVRRLETA
jgi:3-isopropylmalate/(R)-2-methylmalate dehydratase large subunit